MSSFPVLFLAPQVCPVATGRRCSTGRVRLRRCVRSCAWETLRSRGWGRTRRRGPASSRAPSSPTYRAPRCTTVPINEPWPLNYDLHTIPISLCLFTKISGLHSQGVTDIHNWVKILFEIFLEILRCLLILPGVSGGWCSFAYILADKKAQINHFKVFLIVFDSSLLMYWHFGLHFTHLFWSHLNIFTSTFLFSSSTCLGLFRVLSLWTYGHLIIKRFTTLNHPWGSTALEHSLRLWLSSVCL